MKEPIKLTSVIVVMMYGSFEDRDSDNYNGVGLVMIYRIFAMPDKFCLWSRIIYQRLSTGLLSYTNDVSTSTMNFVVGKI